MSTVLTNPANTLTLTPSDNYTLSSVDDTDHPFRFEPGGRIAGDTNAGSHSIFLRFALPARAPGTVITRAMLDLHASPAVDGEYPLSIYAIPNDWQVSDMRDGHRPFASGTPLARFDSVSCEGTQVEITSAVDSAYQIDGIITLLIANAEYTYNARDFPVDKELIISISAAS